MSNAAAPATRFLRARDPDDSDHPNRTTRRSGVLLPPGYRSSRVAWSKNKGRAEQTLPAPVFEASQAVEVAGLGGARVITGGVGGHGRRRFSLASEDAVLALPR